MSSSFVPLPTAGVPLQHGSALDVSTPGVSTPGVSTPELLKPGAATWPEGPAQAAPLAATVDTLWASGDPATWCDLAFGAGALFLALWQSWRTSVHGPQRLHIVAVCEQPYTGDALRACHDAWRLEGDLADLARRLRDQWPAALPGQHRLIFESGRVTLTLLFGPASTTLGRASFSAQGFIWQTPPDDAAVCRQRIALASRHSNAQACWVIHHPHVNVHDALRHAAFVVATPHEQSVVSVAHRRAGVPVRHAARTGALARRRRSTGQGDALVVGAGLAGAHAARALAERGWRVRVLARDMPHDGHVAAALTPVIARDDNPRARLTRAGALRAAAVWRALNTDAVRRCGTVQLDRAQGRAGELAESLAALHFPPGWVRAVDVCEASRLSGVPLSRGGVFFSQGMVVHPDRLIRALFDHPAITLAMADLARLEYSGGQWRALGAAGVPAVEADQVVLATAVDTPHILAASGLLAPLPVLAGMHALAGEIAVMPARPELAPRCIVAGEGYLLPAWDGQVVAGSTYRHGASSSQVSPDGQQAVFEKVAGMLADAPAPPRSCRGWAGWRAVVPGRLPVIGELAHARGLWLATGFASRGLTWSALAGEIIAGALDGEPGVLDSDLMRLIAPR